MDELDLKDKFLAKAKDKPQYLEHDIEGIGRVYIKRLTAGEKDLYEKLTPGRTTSRAVTVAHCCFDERGARVFGDSDIPALELIDASIVDPIVMVALRFNGYTKAEQDELLKNSNGQAVNS